MTIAKKPASIEIINDVNGSIINFYRQLRNNGPRLRKAIKLTPYARQELSLAREPAKGLSDLEKARRFFITAMMAINGSFGDTPGGFSYSDSYARNGMEARVSRWAQMHKYLEEVTERLKSVRIEHLDAIKLFSKYSDRPATLVYFDPPYLAERVNGYDHEANTSEFHEKILKAIVKAKCMVFISGYENKLYNRYLTKKSGWSKKIVKATTKGNNGKSFERSEVVWFNPAYKKALALKRGIKTGHRADQSRFPAAFGVYRPLSRNV